MAKTRSSTKPALHPGEIVPKSGQYEIVEANGTRTGIERTGVEGKKLPPTLKPGQTYVIVDTTKTQG